MAFSSQLSRALAITVALLGAAVSAQTVPAPPVVAQKHALLIGCTAYSGLEDFDLLGPSNDVALTTDLLRSRFGFADDEIVTLVHENDAPRRPTYDNIVREFDALIGRVGPGDNVFILLGGHGSQLKDDNPRDAGDDEYDGLDEVFLPEDVTSWEENAIVKAIRDDQIRGWLDAIRARGAFVFFVADTCHAGTLNSAAEDEGFEEGAWFRERHVSAQVINAPDAFNDWDRGDPESKDAANSPVASDFVSAPSVAAPPTESTGEVGGLIALFAVDERTLEQEHAMPPEYDIDGPHYGRLSFALNSVLADSKRPLIYRELSQQIRWRYEQWGWRELGYMHGVPEEFNRVVLGNGSWRNRSAVTVTRDDVGNLSIDAGLLNGAYVGNVYRVYPPAGAEGDDVAAGCVLVTAASPTRASVDVCEYGDVPLADRDKLPTPGRCELAYSVHNSMKMSVEITPWLGDFDEADLDRVDQLVRNLAGADDAVFRLADVGQQPDAVVLVENGSVYLRHIFDATNERVEQEEALFPQEAFGPFAADGSADSEISSALRALARATNIRRAATAELQATVFADEAASIEVGVERFTPEVGEFESVDVAGPLVVYEGDALRVSVFNRGRTPVDVTMLHIDRAGRISSHFSTVPGAGQSNLTTRIIPGGDPAFAEIAIEGGPIGLEDMLVIAQTLTPGMPPQNFAFLEQAELDPVNGEVDSFSALNTPAGRLFAALAFGRGDAGGSAAADLARFAVRRVSWTKRVRDADGE